MPVQDYIRKRFFPHIWCGGCGHGIILKGILSAIEELQLQKKDVVMVSGIGCSSRIVGYTDFHTLHTLHGRALAFATGVKFSKPSLNVIVPMGDGDAMAIGGNHFIHACRRNINMTAVIMNNRIYGMTGGQFSPLSGQGVMATTAPLGNIDYAFDTVELAKGAGGTFVARTTAYHYAEIVSIMKKAIQHKGFSVVEILSQCPTYFGRKNKMKGASEMMDFFKDRTTSIGSDAKKADPTLIERGIFVQKESSEYCENYDKIIEMASKGKES
ncbi:MAG TPA: 2-oxoacid:ferredoxin oxidoreductase subunit beta [Lentisphaeria bacterium]|nr:MAG: 2-oxoacid:ferredoxin oxidoreductase subunit beta [Lentisphaerae bacterium GWF2_38_69]HBM16874.1 2-oxoacid:ferredoxin oxidoreductase subunit beta [Lentisphaeria bacterium]